MEVRHINRSSSATRQPKVYTGAKSNSKWPSLGQVCRAYYNRTTTSCVSGVCVFKKREAGVRGGFYIGR